VTSPDGAGGDIAFSSLSPRDRVCFFNPHASGAGAEVTLADGGI
jgi:hypothetical protein